MLENVTNVHRILGAQPLQLCTLSSVTAGFSGMGGPSSPLLLAVLGAPLGLGSKANGGAAGSLADAPRSVIPRIGEVCHEQARGSGTQALHTTHVP